MTEDEFAMSFRLLGCIILYTSAFIIFVGFVYGMWKNME